MFRLKHLRENSTDYQTLLECSRCEIGSEGPLAYLFPPLLLRKKHLVIEVQQDACYADNVVHDPKTLINGAPFWKKRLKSGDRLSIGGQELLFEEIAKEPAPVVDEENETLTYQTASEKPSFIQRKVKPAEPEPQPMFGFRLNQGWILLGASLLFACVILGTMTYIALSEKSLMLEKKAARGLADVAVTLAHSKIYGSVSDRQNYLDPEFLIHNAKALLPEQFCDHGWVDGEGHFANCPYFLRIYSDGSLSRFLLIAQPTPRLLQSLIPRSALLIDSATMKMHKISDLRSLNRLLASVNSLKEMNEQAFNALMTQSPPLKMQFLASGIGEDGFNPPEELAIIDPVAQYRIDLAPRYYQWRRTNEEFKKLNLGEPNIVYTAGGIDDALRLRAELVDNYDTQNNCCLVGYVSLTPEGMIRDSNLLMLEAANDQPQELTENSPSNKSNLLLAINDLKNARSLAIQEAFRPLYFKIHAEQTTHSRLFFDELNIILTTARQKAETEQAIFDQALMMLYNINVVENGTISQIEFLDLLHEENIDIGYVTFAEEKNNQEETLDFYLDKIDQSQSIEELDHTTFATYHFIEKTMTLGLNNTVKSQVKNRIIPRLEALLWQEPNHTKEVAVQKETPSQKMWMLDRILRYGFIDDTKSRAFYLSQLDL